MAVAEDASRKERYLDRLLYAIKGLLCQVLFAISRCGPAHSLRAVKYISQIIFLAQSHKATERLIELRHLTVVLIHYSPRLRNYCPFYFLSLRLCAFVRDSISLSARPLRRRGSNVLSRTSLAQLLSFRSVYAGVRRLLTLDLSVLECHEQRPVDFCVCVGRTTQFEPPQPVTFDLGLSPHGRSDFLR